MQRSIRLITGMVSIYLLMCIQFETHAQQQADTALVLRPVAISADIPAAPYQIDTLQMQVLHTERLDELLAASSGLFTRQYGEGQLATMSLRGTASRHTAVVWNGLSLNSPLNGLFDLSLLPVAAMSKVSIIPGTAATNLRTGTPGGLVQTQSAIAYNKPLYLSAGFGHGSFGTYSGNAHLGFSSKAGKTNIAGALWGSYMQAENAFPVLHPALEGHTREDASYRRTSFGADFGLLNADGSQLEGHVLIGDAWRQIPPALQAITHSETQDDLDVLASLAYSKSIQKWDLSLLTGYVKSASRYTNHNLGISPLNASNSYTARVDISRTGALFTHRAGLISNFSNGDTDGYSSINRTVAGASVSSEVKSKKGFFAKADLYLELMRERDEAGITREDFPFQPTLTAGFIASKSKLIIGVQRHFSRPSLNDLYWNPGGNTALNSERGYTADLVFELKTTETSSVSNVIAIESWYHRITNWIQWAPGHEGFWTAHNLEAVSSPGASIRLKGHWQSEHLQLSWLSNYTFTHARSETGDVLLYSPAHQAGLSLSLHWKSFGIVSSTTYTGTRFTATDASAQLDAFGLTNVSLTWAKTFDTFAIRVLAGSDNVSNTYYEPVAARPMPGRALRMSLQVNWHKNKKQ